MTDDERFDIDLGGLGRALARNWIVIVILVVVGVVAAVGVTYATGKRYQAASAVYLGQPTDANGNPINGINSNPRGAEQIVQSGDVLREAAQERGRHQRRAAARRGLGRRAHGHGQERQRAHQLRHHHGAGSLRAPRRQGGERAGRRSSSRAYPATPTRRLRCSTGRSPARRSRLDGLDDRITKRSGPARSRWPPARHGGGEGVRQRDLPGDHRSGRQPCATQLVQQLQSLQLARVVARDVEQPTLFSKASLPAKRVTPGFSLAIAAGLVAGLVVGCVVALVRERVRRRARRRPPDPSRADAPAPQAQRWIARSPSPGPASPERAGPACSPPPDSRCGSTT